MIGFMNPENFGQVIQDIGFVIVKELKAKDMIEQYLQNNPISFSGFSRIVLLKKGLS